MGYVDIHTHILPYLDDGSENMETTLEMLRIAQREGITHMIATPHYRAGYYRADSERLYESLFQVQQLAEANGILIELYAGNEIYYRKELDDKLYEGNLCTLNGTEYVLVEFPTAENFVYIRNAMDELFCMGYTPIIAHVERYQCLTKNVDNVRELKDMGCGIQVNAASVTGENGFKSKRFVHKLLKKQLVDYIGTDAHNTSGRKPAMKKCAKLLYKKYNHDYTDAVLFENAWKNLLAR